MVRETIRGDARIDAHGPTEMPAWGIAFRYVGSGSRLEIGVRINNLTEYIKSLQRIKIQVYVSILSASYCRSRRKIRTDTPSQVAPIMRFRSGWKSAQTSLDPEGSSLSRKWPLCSISTVTGLLSRYEDAATNVRLATKWNVSFAARSKRPK